ncbi:MAG: hypothetical protein J5614_03445 [Paludibacteraceae bacterium]|nr:hypothetical protein [Paludibacteraceae bacterium]
MGQKIEGRIKRFDSIVEEAKGFNAIMKDDGEEVVAIKGVNTQLTGDLIDLMFEEYAQCKVAVALVFSCDLPNGAAVAINIDDKGLEWTTVSKPNGDIELQIEFIMTDSDHESQIQYLRDNGVQGYVLKLSEDGTDYIDYGELSPKCVIHVTLHKEDVRDWWLRSESVDINISKADDETQEGYIHGIMVDLTAKTRDLGDEGQHHILIGCCTAIPLFTEEDIGQGIPFPHEDDDNVTVLTDDDLKCDPEPDGYSEWDGETPNPVFEKYRDMIRIVKDRADKWRCIFSIQDDTFRDWVLSISDKAVNGKLQIYQKDFLQYLLANDLYDAYMIKLNAELDKLHTEEAKHIVAQKLSSYIKKESTITKLLETRDAMNRYLICMIGVMDDLKIAHDQDGVVDIEKIPQDKLDEMYKRIDELPQKKDCDMMIYDLVIAIALEAGLMTEEQSQLPANEVVELEGYKTVFDNIAGIVKEFTKM